MSAVNASNEIHLLGEYVTGQNEGRNDQPITGNDLYNFAVQTDSNFMAVRGDIRNLGTVMNGEFKGVEARFSGVEARFSGVEARFSGVDNEFKLLRMEMASGFAAINARFEIVDARLIGIDAEFKVVDAKFKGVDAEFKALRAEMKEGFALLRIEIQRSNWRVSVSTIGAMIALFGIDRFWL